MAAPTSLPNPAKVDIHYTAPIIRTICAANVLLGVRYLAYRFHCMQHYKATHEIRLVSYACIYFLGEVSTHFTLLLLHL